MRVFKKDVVFRRGENRGEVGDNRSDTLVIYGVTVRAIEAIGILSPNARKAMVYDIAATIERYTSRDPSEEPYWP